MTTVHQKPHAHRPSPSASVKHAHNATTTTATTATSATTTTAATATQAATHDKPDTLVQGGRPLGDTALPMSVAADARVSSLVGVRTVTGGARANKDIIHALDTREKFDKLFSQGASVTAGAPSELKFLIDRKTHEIYFLPPKYEFHYFFYRDVLHGPMDNATFDERAYNRPDRDFIAGTVTAYDSFVDPNGKKGAVCFSLWPTDRFDADMLKETHDAVRGALQFLGAGDDVSFRPGGPIQDKLLTTEGPKLKTLGVDVKTNLEISAGLKYMALSKGDAVGKLVVIEPGQAMPKLTRSDVAIFLGDVPPDAPPVAAIITSTVQTYNSHLGIKYRQDDTPYFYKSFTPEEIADLKAKNGTFVKVSCGDKEGTIAAATEAEAKKHLEDVKPKGHVRLAPNLAIDKVMTFSELAQASVGQDGKWNPEILAAYGRKTLGVVQLAELVRTGKLPAGVIAPKEPMGVPASWYTRFMRTAVDDDGVTFSDRAKAMRTDPRFTSDPAWQAEQLAAFRKAIEKAKPPAAMLQDVHDQIAVPYLKTHPGALSARVRSSAPVVEDSNSNNTNKLPNMAGAFDSDTAHWKKGKNAKETAENAAKKIAESLMKDYASVWNDRAVSEMLWNNVDMDEESVAMACLVMPNEEGELGNGVLRVNQDLAGFFSITGETQFGENLVTNPQAGATPDTFIDGNYDVLNGQVLQDIEYERVSNQTSSDPNREHAFSDDEIHKSYDSMHVIRDHFAKLEGKDPATYVDECEVKITADGKIQFKQERPWVE